MTSIYIYSPSGAVRDRAAFKRGIKYLTHQGYEVEVDPCALNCVERFAGSDEERIASIKRACTSGADVAMITRGGYGLTRLLPDLPYKSIAKSIKGGTRFVGLSDFTAFQMAVFAKTGAKTWSGPALLSDFGSSEGVDEITNGCFEDFATSTAEGVGWRLSSAFSKELFKKSLKRKSELQIENEVLFGGNLAMICSLIGTPFFPTVKGGILFLEDTGEHPYRVERMLMHLYHSGVLNKLKAIIFGSFTDYKLTPHDKGYTLKSVFEYLHNCTKVPVICDLPFGHSAPKVCLPFGHKVTLVNQGNEILLFWKTHAHFDHRNTHAPHHLHTFA
jgi:muramoyltetrapeptide carboxypeptidase